MPATAGALPIVLGEIILDTDGMLQSSDMMGSGRTMLSCGRTPMADSGHVANRFQPAPDGGMRAC
jgi:hypothetical protein